MHANAARRRALIRVRGNPGGPPAPSRGGSRLARATPRARRGSRADGRTGSRERAATRGDLRHLDRPRAGRSPPPATGSGHRRRDPARRERRRRAPPFPRRPHRSRAAGHRGRWHRDAPGPTAARALRLFGGASGRLRSGRGVARPRALESAERMARGWAARHGAAGARSARRAAPKAWRPARLAGVPPPEGDRLRAPPRHVEPHGQVPSRHGGGDRHDEATGRARARSGHVVRAGGRCARDGPRRGRGDRPAPPRRLPAVGTCSRPRRVRSERDAALRARRPPAGRGRSRAARSGGRPARARRALRPAGGSRTVAPARRRDGRRGARRARGWTAGVALVRAAARRRGHARGQPARRRRSGLAALFAAVVGILVIVPPLRRGLSALPRPLAEGAAVTLAATLSTAPLLAHHFGAVSVVGVLANVAALPLVAPIMWLGMVQVALGVVGGGAVQPLASALGHVTGVLVGWLDGLARHFAELPGSRVAVALPTPLSVVGAYAAMACAALVARRLARRSEPRAREASAAWRRAPARRRAALVATTAAVAALAWTRLMGARTHRAISRSPSWTSGRGCHVDPGRSPRRGALRRRRTRGAGLPRAARRRRPKPRPRGRDPSVARPPGGTPRGGGPDPDADAPRERLRDPRPGLPPPPSRRPCVTACG